MEAVYSPGTTYSVPSTNYEVPNTVPEAGTAYSSFSYRPTFAGPPAYSNPVTTYEVPATSYDAPGTSQGVIYEPMTHPPSASPYGNMNLSAELTPTSTFTTITTTTHEVPSMTYAAPEHTAPAYSHTPVSSFQPMSYSYSPTVGSSFALDSTARATPEIATGPCTLGPQGASAAPATPERSPAPTDLVGATPLACGTPLGTGSFTPVMSFAPLGTSPYATRNQTSSPAPMCTKGNSPMASKHLGCGSMRTAPGKAVLGSVRQVGGRIQPVWGWLLHMDVSQLDMCLCFPFDSLFLQSCPTQMASFLKHMFVFLFQRGNTSSILCSTHPGFLLGILGLRSIHPQLPSGALFSF